VRKDVSSTAILLLWSAVGWVDGRGKVDIGEQACKHNYFRATFTKRCGGNLRGSSAQTRTETALEKDEDTKEEVPADGSETTMEWREGPQ